MLVLFLDESGDHSLHKFDPQYPMFVLAGCVLEETGDVAMSTGVLVSLYYQKNRQDPLRSSRLRLNLS